jgi:hypothetical protein
MKSLPTLIPAKWPFPDSSDFELGSDEISLDDASDLDSDSGKNFKG